MVRYTVPQMAIETFLRVFDVMMKIFRIVEPLLSGFACCLITWLMSTYFNAYLPYMKVDVFSYPTNIITSIGLFFVFNIFWNYLLAISTRAGTPIPNEEPELGIGVYKEYATHFDWNYCRRCKCVKPPHSHHCRVCGKCILHMDHHCPWISNCVGLKNYRYFVLFMFWVVLGLSFLFIHYVWPVWFSDIPRSQLTREMRDLKRTLTLACVISLSAGIPVFCLLSFHIYLICTAQSTIEFYMNSRLRRSAAKRGETWVNPSDLGWKKNFQRIFHAHNRFWWLTWCLPYTVDQQPY